MINETLITITLATVTANLTLDSVYIIKELIADYREHKEEKTAEALWEEMLGEMLSDAPEVQDASDTEQKENNTKKVKK